MNSINFSNCKLLLAEDDPDQVIHLRHALKTAELNPPFWVARDGEEAIDYLKRELEDDVPPTGPTIFFLDLKMPRKNGFEVLEWIRQQPAFSKMIVIMLTNSEDPRDEHRSYELGANSYIVKPGGQQELVKLVKTLLTFRLYWDQTDRTHVEPFRAMPAGHALQLTNAA